MKKKRSKKIKKTEMTFEEKLKVLGKSIGTVNIGTNTDEICKEVRYEEK